MLADLSKSASKGIAIGQYLLPVASLQGIISAFILLLCILMVFIHYKIGSKIAVAVIIVSMTNGITQIIQTHALYSLPGIISSTVSLFSIFIIYVFYKRSSIISYTDMITGLKNRRKFIEEISDKLQDKKDFFLACVEVEGFKQINETYGMETGDYILQKTAEHMIRLIGKKTNLYKITGAIFTIVFDTEENARAVLKEITRTETLSIPLKSAAAAIRDEGIKISLAAGVSRFPEDAGDEQTLMAHADTAMTAAKKLNAEKICFYSSELEVAEKKQREAESLINQALEHDWFYLVYQPQLTLTNRSLRGFETLIRCKRPDGTTVSPADFIPAAEKSNLIIKIDDYVLHHALKEFKPLLEKKHSPYILSINVSAKNIGSPDFAQRIRQLLSESQFPAHNLEIEITEYSLADSLDVTIANIKSLRELGVQVALDDFGTGYTSIAQLIKLPINLLKIDKSLIDDIEVSQTIRDLVDSVIYMGHIMNCEVISEGVENEKQIDVLKKHKCDFVQGFVWGKPMSFNDVQAMC